jgi:hypothetical protein
VYIQGIIERYKFSALVPHKIQEKFPYQYMGKMQFLSYMQKQQLQFGRAKTIHEYEPSFARFPQ